MSAEQREEILDRHGRYESQTAIAEALQLHVRWINAVVLDARAAGDPRAAKHPLAIVQARRLAKLREEGKLATGARPRCQVPQWAKDAGLAEDYRIYARQAGEEFAAAACRRLKRDMTRGFAG